MKRLLVLMAAFLGMASAYLKSYEVTPTLASWSGWAGGDPQFGVGNTFTANFDSITEVQVFVGHLGANPSTPFKVDVNEYPGGNLVAYNGGVAADREHSWVKFPMTPYAGGKFVRGKEYLLKVHTERRLNARLNAGLDSEYSQSTISMR